MVQVRRKASPGNGRLCVTTGQSKPLQIAGYVLLGLGALILFLCIPCWAWVALLGVALLGLGILLQCLGKAGR